MPIINYDIPNHLIPISRKSALRLLMLTAKLQLTQLASAKERVAMPMTSPFSTLKLIFVVSQQRSMIPTGDSISDHIEGRVIDSAVEFPISAGAIVHRKMKFE